MTTGRPRRRLLVGGVLALVGAVVGGAVALATPVSYTAEATSFVSTPSSSGVHLLERPAPNGWAPSLVQTYAGLVAKPVVLDPVIRRLRLHTTATRLAPSVSASADDGSTLIRIRVVDRDPGRAARIANAVQAELTRAVPKVSPSGGRSPDVRIAAVQPARAPSSPSGPNAGLDVLLGAGAGALLELLVLGGIGAVRALRRPVVPGPPPSMF